MRNEIITERLLLRHFKMRDKFYAHHLFKDYETMRMCGIMPPLSKESETKKRIKEWMNDEGRYAILLKERFIGYIAVFLDSEEKREDTRELAFALNPEVRHKGYMREAILGMLFHLKNEGIKYVWACCYKENDSSRHLIESLGFIFQNEGSFDSLNDKAYPTLEYRITL